MDLRPTATGQIKSTKELFSKEWDFNISLQLNDIRKQLSVNDRFVPVIGSRNDGFFRKRQELFNEGVYPGVEYRIKAILIQSNTDSVKSQSLSNMTNVAFSDDLRKIGRNDSLFVVIRPAYPLIPELERQWPVIVPLDIIPFCLTRGSYNTLTVLASSFLALSFLSAAWLLSLMVIAFPYVLFSRLKIVLKLMIKVTFSVVNTRSMSPAIQPRDIILVEKVTPVLKRFLHVPIASSGDVIFFKEPENMRRYIKKQMLPPVGDALLVKRVKDVISSGELSKEVNNIITCALSIIN